MGIDAEYGRLVSGSAGVVPADAGAELPASTQTIGSGLAPRLLAAAACVFPGLVGAQTAPPPVVEALRIAECAAIGAGADRLACYDTLAGRAPEPPVAKKEVAEPAAAATSLLAAEGVPAPVAQQAGGSGSLMSAFWELDAADKRGTFNFTGYRPNYVLPLHWTSSINRSPSSPTQQTVQLDDYRPLEAKFQLSLRTKIAQNVLLPGADLWLAFTQQALWQIWNSEDSKPFRNSDYEPEAIYIVPTPDGLRNLPGGWQWRYTQFGLAHQSNGQSDPLSRSWNRVYMGAGFERGDWGFTARVNRRIKEDLTTDNNPDLIDFRGRGEFNLRYSSKLATAALTYRTSLRSTKFGALEFEWTYPIYRDQPNGVRWYVQIYRGYGETLTDYNFRQTSIGAGLTFLSF